MSVLSEISEALQKGRAKLVKELVDRAAQEGFTVGEILENGLLAGMHVVGTKFKDNEVYIPEVLVAARAMNAGTSTLKPLMGAAGIGPIGRACIGTVKGDLHDIGKNLVRMMLESRGIEVIDLGVDVPPEEFARVAKEQECQIVACSALLITTMAVMKEVVNAIKDAGIRHSTKIMVGGAPITEQFCRAIGADAYAPDAASAAEMAVKLLAV